LKNSSNRHLQRIQVSRSDARLGETPRRLQQWDFVAKGGPSAIVRYEIADVIGEEASSEVIKCETDHKSSDINNVSKKTAATNEYNHSKAIIPHDYDERNYAYRSGIRGSINRNSQYSDCNTNNIGDINPQRNISVKITLEAEEVPEKNVDLFSKNVTNSTDNDKVFSIDETTLNSFQRYNCNVTSGTAPQNQTVQQTQLGYFPLKKSADYGSTISSLTQSSNMKTEVSDIDFSWVNDVENRLEREIAFVREGFTAFPPYVSLCISVLIYFVASAFYFIISFVDSQQQIQREQLPVQYFGVDFDQSKPGKDKAAVVLLPAYTVTTKSLEVFGECESRKELNQIHSDVRSKAAMFDTAFRNEQKVLLCF
uniref:PHM7_ext domain-containing protein n=1 Tax=Brugia timori TaxID=42155 RepID=A0A0R3QCI8_9BILA